MVKCRVNVTQDVTPMLPKMLRNNNIKFVIINLNTIKLTINLYNKYKLIKSYFDKKILRIYENKYKDMKSFIFLLFHYFFFYNLIFRYNLYLSSSLSSLLFG